MKKFFAVFIALTFLLVTFIPEAMGQTRRKKKNTRGLATNIAIVGGSTAAGAIIGRGRGAAIGAGAGLVYASSRKGTKRRHRNSNVRRAAKVTGGTLVGAGVGSAVGGRRGAVVGGALGAGTTYLYTRNGRKYYRASNGRQFYVRNGKRYYR